MMHMASWRFFSNSFAARNHRTRECWQQVQEHMGVTHSMRSADVSRREREGSLRTGRKRMEHMPWESLRNVAKDVSNENPLGFACILCRSGKLYTELLSAELARVIRARGADEETEKVGSPCRSVISVGWSTHKRMKLNEMMMLINMSASPRRECRTKRSTF